MKTSLIVTVCGTRVATELTDVLTAGMVGVPVKFRFDESWNELRRLAVFEGSGQKKYLDLNLGGELTIPWEVLLEERTMVRVGVEGRNADGTVVIPTRWAEVGVVLSGAKAGNDPALEPTPTVYDQIMKAIDSGRLKGERGPQGEQGPAGKQGPAGPQGETGAPGKDAQDGAAPIVAAATRESIQLTDSAAQKLRGLKLYGWSRQDGTPSPDNPVEIVSAGAKGSITVNIDGDTPQTLTALTPNGLPGIKVSSGGTHTDSTGQQSICDEIDAGRGVYIQIMGIRVYTGEEKILATGYPKSFTVEQLDCDYDKPILCSHFAFSNQYGGSKPGAGASSFSKAIIFNFSGTGIVTVERNPAEAKAWFKAQYDNGTPVVVRYVLATPIERPLTKEELAQFAALHTNYPTTTILNDEGVGMEVSYVADTKNYIDKKFNELAAAIVANP